MKKKTIFQFSFVGVLLALIMVSACKKDPANTNNTNNNSNTADVKPYLLFEGKKFVCAQPKYLHIIKIGGDSALEWWGTGLNDTVITIMHKNGNISPKQYSLDTIPPVDNANVMLGITWGTNLSSPDILVTSGTYELKKENGKFVSYLKNGEGYDEKVGNAKRYKNIEFKVVWPF